MGIDIYLGWENQTEAEKEAQFTGFSAVHGFTGYLREAYHGEPYATKTLIPAQYWEGDVMKIQAKTLRDNLPAALEAVKLRQQLVYKVDNDQDTAEIQKSFEDFVLLAEAKEAEGKAVTVHVSA